MVEQGFGVTILPRLLLEQAPFRVCVRPFDAHYTRTLGVAWSDTDNPAPAIRKFLEYVRSYVSQTSTNILKVTSSATAR